MHKSFCIHFYTLRCVQCIKKPSEKDSRIYVTKKFYFKKNVFLATPATITIALVNFVYFFSTARRTSTWRRVLGYPLIMLSLLVLTGLSLLCVIMNVCQIVAGFRTLPVYQSTVVVDLGITSLSSLGVIGK